MYLYGVGEHAKVVVDILESQCEPIMGYVDDNISVEQFRDRKVLRDAQGCSPIIVSIGNNLVRKRVVEKLLGHSFGTAVHSSAIVSPTVSIGVGTVVMPGAVINAESCVGQHCIINTGASVDHDCQLGDFVHIAPHATLCGNVQVDEGGWVGAGATIIPGIKIGKWAVVGAGAVVIRDVPDMAVVAGVPAKVIKYKE